MCSIFGILNFDAGSNQHQFDNSFLRKINGVLAHRGPDDAGYYHDKAIAMTHNRLSIQDLSQAGHQPMFSACGNYVISYNGEIYNHHELRRKYLPAHQFRGHSDTETLIELYADFQRHGKDLDFLLNQLNGMFAIAIWDIRNQCLFLARDRLGVKPLFIYRKGHVLSFASEIKAFKAACFDLEVSEQGIANYFVYGYSPSPSTIYKNIMKFKPGTLQVLKQEGATEATYWSKYGGVSDFVGNYQDAVLQLRELIADAIRMRLISDVPFGAFLSGGVDSSAITYFMQKFHGSSINTYSVGFEVDRFTQKAIDGNKFSELPDARLVAERLGSVHHELVIGANDLMKNIEALSYCYDEPFGDPAAFPMYMICQLAKKKITVCHSGDGADEIFGGYRRYAAHLFSENHPFLSKLYLMGYFTFSSWLPASPRLAKIAAAYQEQSPIDRYSHWLETLERSTYFELTGMKLKINPDYQCAYTACRKDVGKFMLMADQGTLLPDVYLEKVDKASMASSLEVRVPFLDYRLLNFCNSLPAKWKIGRISKRIFKDALKGAVPAEILHKPKRGFTVPISDWFRSDLMAFIQSRLLDSSALYACYGLNKKVVERCLREHIKQKHDYSGFLWQMLMFVVWSDSKTGAGRQI